jgi:hypothetical protein
MQGKFMDLENNEPAIPPAVKLRSWRNYTINLLT